MHSWKNTFYFLNISRNYMVDFVWSDVMASILKWISWYSRVGHIVIYEFCQRIPRIAVSPSDVSIKGKQGDLDSSWNPNSELNALRGQPLSSYIRLLSSTPMYLFDTLDRSVFLGRPCLVLGTQHNISILSWYSSHRPFFLHF